MKESFGKNAKNLGLLIESCCYFYKNEYFKCFNVF